jgi:hypothetical protein
MLIFFEIGIGLTPTIDLVEFINEVVLNGFPLRIFKRQTKNKVDMVIVLDCSPTKGTLIVFIEFF